MMCVSNGMPVAHETVWLMPGLGAQAFYYEKVFTLKVYLCVEFRDSFCFITLGQTRVHTDVERLRPSTKVGVYGDKLLTI